MTDIPGARVVASTSTALGAALLVRPTTQGAPPMVARALAVRLIGQGVVQALRPTPTVVRLGAVADLLHATSMVAAAAIWPRYRRPAAISALIAFTSAGYGLAATR